MTAIAGLWRFDGQPDVAADCTRMLAAQKIYGPHHGAQWDNGALAIGRQLFRMLPEDSADRGPVECRDGQMVMVADVRLDNREELIAALGLSAEKFRRACDSEILLASLNRWSEAALDRVVGDFAFALWDERRQQLMLARDFMGQKPLHYHWNKNFFAFSSMAKGLHTLPEIPYAPDEQTVAEFVALMPQSGPGSFFQDISRVEQGQIVTVSRKGVSKRSYWNPRRPERGVNGPRDWVEGVRHHLDQATRARLRGANGAVASHLSSGFDSSAVTATAARLLAAEGGRVTAFTSVPSVDPEADPNDRRIFDEGPLAAATAALYPNVEHVLLRTGHISPFDDFDRTFYLYERPKLNPCNWVWLRQITQEAHDRKLGIVLHGMMGDMTFSYFGMQLLPELLRQGRWVRLAQEYVGLRRETGVRLRGFAGQTFGPYLPIGLWNRLKTHFHGYHEDVFHHTAINPQRFAEMNLAARAKARDHDLSYRPRKDSFADRKWVLSRTDPGNNNKGTLGGWGVDLRDPTADRRLVEYCLSIPTDQYLVNGVARAVGKAALRDRLPDAVLDAPKRGYQASDWHVGLTGARTNAAVELDQIAGCDAAARTLDIPRLQGLLEELPTRDWHDPLVIRAYRLALLRGMSAGHFLRKASGSNG
ncbi:asparagine synthetase B family protein [Parasphingorhabdus sp.]|uniref:asparagine synthetase B family protein n=1 Tax=Parasphingorhabdus sp. TaxID=2709688 RepID=UPI003A93A167